MRGFPLFLALGLAACDAGPPATPDSDVHELLALHEAGLAAHLNGDVDALLAVEADDFLLVNRGEISSPSRDQRRQILGPYLAATRFEFYRDAVTPIVKVSRDGSLAWVAAKIEARGIREGSDRPLEFKVAWIELYERRGGEWISIGNASSFEPTGAKPGT
jgi:ketosteroid isomerase-like protein